MGASSGSSLVSSGSSGLEVLVDLDKRGVGEDGSGPECHDLDRRRRRWEQAGYH